MAIFDVLASIVPTALFFSAPLIFTALGGVFCDGSGVREIGLVGLMVIVAFVAIVFNLTFADVVGALTPSISILVAMLVSAIFSPLPAVAPISFRADQPASGVAINFLALGI